MREDIKQNKQPFEKKFEHAIVAHPFLYDSRSDVFSFIVN